MVDAQIELIGIVRLHGIAQIIVRRSKIVHLPGRVRLGEHAQKLRRNGIPERLRNHISRERRASHGIAGAVDGTCIWVVNRIERYPIFGRKITLPHGVRRHSGQLRLPRADTRSLVIEEEKRPVLSVVDFWNVDGRADAEPELILLERGNRSPIRVIEEIIGVQIAVA